VPYRSVASSAWTSAGIVASAPSVARFGDALFRGSLITDDSRKQVLAFVPADGPYTGYGLGVGKGYSQQLSQPVWVAVGNFPGFGGILAHLPSKGVTVVVLANRDNATGITAAIADRLLARATKPRKAD
jgi:CubicO group peptidase (beta-lactamase class C family)